MRRGFLSLGGFMPPDGIKHTLSTAAGFVGSNMLTERLGARWPQLATGNARIATKAAVALAGYALLKRFGPPGTAAAFGIGGLTSAALDIYNRAMGSGGMSGLGVWEPDGVTYGLSYEAPNQLATAQQLDQLQDGMGDALVVMDDEDAVLLED